MKKVEANIRGVDRTTPCYGCGACLTVCPLKCISMEISTDGFYYPVVDTESCIECGKCLEICPIEKKKDLLSIKWVYAAKSRNKRLRDKSTSGGVFAELALNVLRRGGIVYGASYVENLEVKHIEIQNERELEKIQGSKYVQSKAYECFEKIKLQLNEGREVLYSGTGCQIAALRNYLEKNYSNLVTVEVVCHGVASPGLFREYLNWLENRYGGKITDFRFRTKKLRPTGEHWKYEYSLKDIDKKYYGYAYKDPYYSSFLTAKILRNSCYSCQFKEKERVADFTLGDFWGIEKQDKKISTIGGINLVLINSLKAKSLFDSIVDNLEINESTFEFANNNPSLTRCISKQKVEIDYKDKELFSKKLKPKKSIKNWIKNRVPWQIKIILKKIR